MLENDYNPDDINRVGKHGNSALMKAVREANSTIAKELIEAGADLELTNVDWQHSLMERLFWTRLHLCRATCQSWN